jgi:hypothetical protein
MSSVVLNKMYKKIPLLDSNSDMPRNTLTKDEIRCRVLKLKQELYGGRYQQWNGDQHDGAQHMLNKVLNILDEYRV